MKTLICGGRIIDPAQNMDEITGFGVDQTIT